MLNDSKLKDQDSSAQLKLLAAHEVKNLKTTIITFFQNTPLTPTEDIRFTAMKGKAPKFFLQDAQYLLDLLNKRKKNKVVFYHISQSFGGSLFGLICGFYEVYNPDQLSPFYKNLLFIGLLGGATFGSYHFYHSRNFCPDNPTKKVTLQITRLQELLDPPQLKQKIGNTETKNQIPPKKVDAKLQKIQQGMRSRKKPENACSSLISYFQWLATCLLSKAFSIQKTSQQSSDQIELNTSLKIFDREKGSSIISPEKKSSILKKRRPPAVAQPTLDSKKKLGSIKTFNPFEALDSDNSSNKPSPQTQKKSTNPAISTISQEKKLAVENLSKPPLVLTPKQLMSIPVSDSNTNNQTTPHAQECKDTVEQEIKMTELQSSERLIAENKTIHYQLMESKKQTLQLQEQLTTLSRTFTALMYALRTIGLYPTWLNTRAGSTLHFMTNYSFWSQPTQSVSTWSTTTMAPPAPEGFPPTLPLFEL